MNVGTICLLCSSVYNSKPTNGICPNCGYNAFSKCQWDDEIIYGLYLKISNESTLESLRKGNIWFQSPKYYQTYSGNSAVCDIRECAFDHITNLPPEVMQKIFPFKKGKIYLINNRLYQFKEYDRGIAGIDSLQQDSYRLFCFYMLQTNENGDIVVPIDNRIKAFGTHYSVIDIDLLKSDLISKISIEKKILAGVKYYSKNYTGVCNPTFKDDRYEYQNETRIILQSDTFLNLDEKEPYKLKFDKALMQKIFSQPQPIECLFSAKHIDDL